MAYGIQTFNSNGTLLLDLDTKQIQRFDVVTYNMPALSKTYVNYPGINVDGHWAVWAEGNEVGIASISGANTIMLWNNDDVPLIKRVFIIRF